MTGAEEVTFSLKVMINKKKTKVLFAESDGHFVDVLLSFLTLPLGRIVKVLEKHYGDDPPIIGCLNTLYNSIVNLDSVHFWTEDAKKILLNPTSSFDKECSQLKLDMSDSKPEFFSCGKCEKNSFWSASKYYDEVTCRICRIRTMKRQSASMHCLSSLSGGVFTIDTTTFIITDDLQISPNAIGLLQAISSLDIIETDNAELMNVTFGISEIMNLLKTSVISHSPLSDLILNKTRQMSHSPLSDLILNKTRQMHSVADEFEEESEEEEEEEEDEGEEDEDEDEDEDEGEEEEETPNSKKMILMVTVQKSSNRLLYAQAREDFVEFLLSLLTIPLGGVESLLSGETCMESIDNLYRSVSDLIEDEYFESPDIKSRLINPKLPHGYISENQILPLTEESLPYSYKEISLFSSLSFPKGQGNYIKGPRTYQVLDDLTVTPFYISSVIHSINEAKIPLSDVKELEIQVGLEEALSILKASLTSNSALTNGLWSHLSNIKPKPEI